MKILISGSRYYSNYQKIFTFLKGKNKEYDNLVIVEGGARGADSLARKACKKLDIEFKEYRANWKKYGKAAGPIRNQKMLDDNVDVDLVAIFHENLNKSKGTKDMMKRAEKENKKIVRFN